MLNIFANTGRRLIDNGYLIVPIKPGTKRPAIDEWSKARMGMDDLSRFPGHGVGVLTGQGPCPLVAIDIDISHPKIGPAVVALCHTQLGETSQRVGAAPRVLLVYRAGAAGWSKRQSSTFFDPNDPTKASGDKNRQAVEILGDGQQLVAYHVHPDTGRPYEWTDLFGGIEYTTARELPIVSQGQIDDLMRDVERLIDDAETIEILAPARVGLEAKTTDAFREFTLIDITDETVADLTSAARALAPWRADEYDTWVRVLMALKSLSQAGRGAAAREIALTFSARSAKHDERVFAKKWDKLNPDAVTYKTIFQLAAADGWINPRKARPLPDRPDGGRVDLTDTGNANALYALTEGNMRFVTELKRWLIWDGQGWRIDESGSGAKGISLAVSEMWQTKAREKETEAQAHTGEDRKRLMKLAESFRSWANHCRNRRGVDNMLAEAARDERFAISLALLDLDRWALGVENGVVDLRTGQLRPAARDDFITKRCPFAFKPDAGAPRWREFIREITGLPLNVDKFQPRPGLALYLQKLLGYAITGVVVEQKMFICVGGGANGKNIALDTVSTILGPHCVQVPPDAMMASSRDTDGERPTPFARKLAGARLAYGSEAKEGQKLNAAWVKKQTGDAVLTARGLHENAFTFPVTHKIVLLTNHQPHLDHMDAATQQRIHVLPFDRRWNRPGLPSPDPALPNGDKALMEKLMGESEGILAWLVEGAAMYAREGLELPQEVAAKTLDYFQQQDAFSLWLETQEKCPAKQGTSASSLFTGFLSWCMESGLANAGPSNLLGFGKALSERGIDKARPSTGTVWGLRSAETF